MPPVTGPTTLALAFAAIVAVVPFIGIAVINIVIARRGWSPLTQLVEDYLRRYPIFAALLSGFVGALVGHVFWSMGDNPPKPPAPAHLLLEALGLALAAGLAGALLLWLLGMALAAVSERLRAGSRQVRK